MLFNFVCMSMMLLSVLTGNILGFDLEKTENKIFQGSLLWGAVVGVLLYSWTVLILAILIAIIAKISVIIKRDSIYDN
jgi:hypothetical protein